MAVPVVLPGTDPVTLAALLALLLGLLDKLLGRLRKVKVRRGGLDLQLELADRV